MRVAASLVAVALGACAVEPAARPPQVTTTAAKVEPAPSAGPPASPRTLETRAFDLEALTPQQPRPTPIPAPGARELGDPQIAAILSAVSGGEIQQARLALARAQDNRVKALAQLLHDQAREAKTRMQMLTSSIDLTPAPTSSSARIAAEEDRALASLGGQSLLVDFDRAYVELQVRNQRRLLDILDFELIPAARDVELRRWLLDLRPRVADTLARARDLQQTLSR